ncbi:MAG TPA: SDR family oxidoreductase [Bacillota bacterium]|nr:SDR family oxidoreductase [Bacillota bacterium]
MDRLFDVSGKVAAITGGGGILCSEMARALAKRGAKVAVLDLSEEQAKAVADEITSQGGTAIAIKTDVLDRKSLENARGIVLENFGKVDILINGAGGNKAEATTSDTFEFFDIPPEAIQWVFNLNLLGTVLATQVFGEQMAKQGEGVIINISSMASIRPLTRTIGYSAAKAAINNFTQWMAVHFNMNYSKNIRVNAIAPGFFLTNQNRFLLTDKDTGEMTPRGKQIINHTPMGRYGDPEDLIGTLIYLVSDASEFVTGIVVPVDGGFSSYSGV